MIILPGCTWGQKVEAVPAERETEAAPVDVGYEVKSEDNSTSDNTEA